MARLLRINGFEVDIDESTAIGIDLQSYDVKDPSKRFFNVTNSFTIPLTTTNNKIIGWASDPQTLDKSIYSPMIADYWIDNIKIIDNAIVRIDEISNRISCYLVVKPSLWDELQLLTWSQFAREYIEWINPQTDTYENIVTNYVNSTNGLVLPQFLGQLSKHQVEKDAAFTEDIANIWIQFKEINGGHFCIFAKEIFRFIEFKYNISSK